MKKVETDLLEIAFEDEGPRDGEVALLLHGWPDDATSWSQVAPLLNTAGIRTITPMLRGFGETRFLSPDAPRTGNPGRLALDAIALLDNLGVTSVCVAGHDWGSNTVEAMAVGWPGRVKRLAMLSTPPRLGGLNTPSFEQAQRQWYHWFQATKRGEEAVRADPHGFAHIMWVNWAPEGWFDEATFQRVALSFDNPDWLAVTLHSYRSRWGEADPDASSAELEAKVKAAKSISTPALYIQGEVDGVNPPPQSEKVEEKFSGPFERIVLEGVGHFPPREAPDAVAAHLLRLFHN